MDNRVIGERMAIVDGKNTGLAGCSNTECPRQCLRKDSRLVGRIDHNKAGGHCRFMIPADAVACPACDSTDVDLTWMAAGVMPEWQEGSCNNCGETWNQCAR